MRSSRLWRTAALARPMIDVLVLAATSAGWLRSARVVGRLIATPQRLKGAAIVSRSGLFDESFYRAQNPDVAKAGVHPLVHYAIWGAFEGRRPHPLFDPAYYLNRYPDVARTAAEPLSHFLLHGGPDERNPSPHFNTRYYLETNPDVRASGVNPLVHFVRTGWLQNRDPSPSFDCAGYLARHSDVRLAGLNPLIEYVVSGRAAGRTATPVKDAPLPPPPQIRLTARAISQRSSTAADHRVVLCLTHVCPWPPHAGNAYRIYRMLRWLKQTGFRVVPVIVPLAGEMPSDKAIRKVEELFSNVVVVDRGGAIRYALADLPDVLAALDGELTAKYSTLLDEERPMSGRARELLAIDRTYCPDAAIATVLRLQSGLGQHVVLAEYVWMTRVLPLIDRRTIKVVDTLDVYSTKKEKVLSFGIEDLWLDEDEEARRLSRADIVIAIQQEEHRILQRLVPDRSVVTAGVDFDVVGTPLLPNAPRVLYIASSNAMNVRGLGDFLRVVWPSVRAQVPTAELIVAGAVGEAMHEDVLGMTRLGAVRDLDELYRSARVVINPALAGTGGKIKTVEALSHLRPIVTFPTGVDGLSDELRDFCDVVQDWEEFGRRVAGRLVDGRDAAFSSLERQRIEHVTSPEIVYADLSERLADLCSRRAVV